MTVFVLQHEYEEPEGVDHTKFIGVYSSRGAAEAAIARIADQPGFTDYPEGFAIDEYQVDKDHWVEGFVS